jgi:hypothetical protein
MVFARAAIGSRAVAAALDPFLVVAADPCGALLFLAMQELDTMATVVATPAAAAPANKLTELSSRLGAEGE